MSHSSFTNVNSFILFLHFLYYMKKLDIYAWYLVCMCLCLCSSNSHYNKNHEWILSFDCHKTFEIKSSFVWNKILAFLRRNPPMILFNLVNQPWQEKDSWMEHPQSKLIKECECFALLTKACAITLPCR